MNVKLGLDIGGTAIKSVALQSSDNFVERYETPSLAASKGFEGVKEGIQKTILHYQNKNFSIESIGIGCAGAIDQKSGIVKFSPNFANWENVPLGDWVSQTFHTPVQVDNDANCATLAEWKLGSASECQHVILLTLGTGIGGGLILNGALYRGATGSAGEIGHMSIYANGEPGSSGQLGEFETYCSASTLRKKCPGFSAKQVVQQSNEEPFRSVFDKFLSDLKVALTSLANIFDPEVIIIGGGVSKGLHSQLSLLEEWVKQHAFPTTGANIRLLLAKHGNWSGAMGAALL